MECFMPCEGISPRIRVVTDRRFKATIPLGLLHISKLDKTRSYMSADFRRFQVMNYLVKGSKQKELVSL